MDSSTASNSFASFVPGFDFLQGLVKNAGAALPTIGQWVAPTLNPEELEKRIEELRTVQFWLEQNAKMLGATIQALEVQGIGGQGGVAVGHGRLWLEGWRRAGGQGRWQRPGYHRPRRRLRS